MSRLRIRIEFDAFEHEVEERLEEAVTELKLMMADEATAYTKRGFRASIDETPDADEVRERRLQEQRQDKLRSFVEQMQTEDIRMVLRERCDLAGIDDSDRRGVLVEMLLIQIEDEVTTPDEIVGFFEGKYTT